MHHKLKFMHVLILDTVISFHKADLIRQSQVRIRRGTMLKLCFALFILGIFTFNSNAMVMSFSRLRPSNDEYFDVSNVKVSFKKSKNHFS